MRSEGKNNGGEMRAILLCLGNYRENGGSSRLKSRMGRKLWWNEGTPG